VEEDEAQGGGPEGCAVEQCEHDRDDGHARERDNDEERGGGARRCDR
jgi:hypothetical protein